MSSRDGAAMIAVPHTCTTTDPIREAWDSLLARIPLHEATRKERSVKGAIGSGLRKQQRLSNDAVARVVSQLRDARAEIIRRIASAQGFDAYYLPQIRASVEGVLRDFQAKYAQEFAALQIDIEKLATDFVALPLARSGIATNFGMLPSQITQTIATFSADTIKGLTDEAVGKVTRELNLAALGGRTRDEAIAAVARHLPGPSTFGSVGARAKTIIRTEVNRIHSITAQARMDQASTIVPGLKKYWLPAYRNTRPSHEQAGIDYGPDNAIPTGDSFKVGGYRAMYPRDPGLPASEAVNCQCQSIPVVPEA